MGGGAPHRPPFRATLPTNKTTVTNIANVNITRKITTTTTAATATTTATTTTTMTMKMSRIFPTAAAMTAFAAAIAAIVTPASTGQQDDWNQVLENSLSRML